MHRWKDNSRTEAEEERDWRDMMRELHLAFYGPRLLVPALSDSRLQVPGKPSPDTAIYATVGDLMKNSTIYLCCNERSCGVHMPFRKEYLEQFKDRVWGPDTNLRKDCPKCGSSNTGVFVSYSGLPHGEKAGGVIGVKI